VWLFFQNHVDDPVSAVDVFVMLDVIGLISGVPVTPAGVIVS
jgi:hypothetical protein